MGLYPDPDPTKRPWWAAWLAFEQTKTAFGIIGAVLLVGSIFYGICGINSPNFVVEKKDVKVTVDVSDGGKSPNGVVQLQGQEESRYLSRVGKWKLGILALWIIVPPIWFWFEHVGLYRYEAKTGREDFEQFKYTQDVASKIWLALVTALTILYFGKDIRA